MTDFEQLGQFYLGKPYDLATKTRAESPLLYDAKDLTTHAVIIGMTGSGKTGLGVGLIEEAAIDKVPVIAVDPKGDLGNLLLTFPSLAASDFRPWVDPRAAETAGQDPDAFAASQAELWSKGLESWGQSGARIERLRAAADFAIYTPGSTAGIPLALLKSFAAPSQAMRADDEAYRDRLDATAGSLIALLGDEVDPVNSREHVLLAAILRHAWDQGQSLDLAGLIGAIQSPPIAQIGVMPVDTVFPAKDRAQFAMRINNLLASPSFQGWLTGEALDANRLFYTADGKPRVSVVSIAHLQDAERMFFLTMLLGEVLSWVRQQPGTSSLRAILYIDELFGYMPPNGNPPTKTLLLTLLKQARAFGLGVVLATQNPVDLDYKGLSNAGTWFVGRLQTERDKMRLMEGLEGAATGGAFDKAKMEETIAGLGKRVFLLHSVHENQPLTFETRWTMSYLAGPMTREQIKTLMKGKGGAAAPASSASPSVATMSSGAGASGSAAVTATGAGRAPVLPPEVPQFALPVSPGVPAESVTWMPSLLGAGDATYSKAKVLEVPVQRRFAYLAEMSDGAIAVDWGNAERVEIDVTTLTPLPSTGAAFGDLVKAATLPKSYPAWQKTFEKYVRTSEVVTLQQSTALKLVSQPGEDPSAFAARAALAAREQRDAAVAKVQQKYATKMQTAANKVRTAQERVQREQADVSSAKMDTALSVGGAILGAFFGKKALSATNVGKVASAAKSMGRANKQSGDVARADENLAVVQQQLAELEAQVQAEMDTVGAQFDAVAGQFTEVQIAPKAADVHVQLVALLWVPYAKDAGGRLLRVIG
ncbi:MAG: DUF87 domain-containing protein [Gemmatimonadaceae bacterium]|jgi:hypothetical protein|nr:DUF87 domain-containing protein [Gemmatimonadaceae bacterium]